MAQLGQRFNAQDHDTTQRDYAGEVPNGIYVLEVDTSEVKPTKTGSGTILATTLKVIAPEEFKGRTIFNNNYNLENSNPKAQEIGQKQFASLCRAIGVDGVDDSEELHYRAFTAKVARGKASVGEDGKSYPGRAEIKRYYFPDEGNVPEPEIDAVQPAEEAPVAANDNKAAPANDNRQPAGRPAPAAAAGGTRRPWGSK
ncbi:UNVERIFIED_ORG: hypothetical protein GGD59_002280 [Rhizobium esperanzae]